MCLCVCFFFFTVKFSAYFRATGAFQSCCNESGQRLWRDRKAFPAVCHGIWHMKTMVRCCMIWVADRTRIYTLMIKNRVCSMNAENTIVICNDRRGGKNTPSSFSGHHILSSLTHTVHVDVMRGHKSTHDQPDSSTKHQSIRKSPHGGTAVPWRIAQLIVSMVTWGFLAFAEQMQQGIHKNRTQKTKVSDMCLYWASGKAVEKIHFSIIVDTQDFW